MCANREICCDGYKYYINYNVWWRQYETKIEFVLGSRNNLLTTVDLLEEGAGELDEATAVLVVGG